MKLKESTTFVNLARAFAGECQDGARYQFLKDKAEREGLAYVGQICTEHATNEMKHAKVFYDFITDNGTERAVSYTHLDVYKRQIFFCVWERA